MSGDAQNTRNTKRKGAVRAVAPWLFGFAAIAIVMVIAILTPPQPAASPTSPVELAPVASSTTAPAPATAIPVAITPEPGWLRASYPRPGQVLSVDEYKERYSSSVCIEVFASSLLQPGDFWEMWDVAGRTTVMVDGAPVSLGEFRDGVVGYTKWDGEKKVAECGGPYYMCTRASLLAGIHQVQVSFRTSSGASPSFTYAFTLVGGPVPTSTSLPTPETFEDKAQLPVYLEKVFPPPGATVSSNPNDSPEYAQSKWPTDLSELLPGAEPDTRQRICFALREKELRKIGSLPGTNDWHERIYLQIDGTLTDYQNNAYSMYYDPNLIVAFCAKVSLRPGKHTAALYIDPLDANLVVYAWQFRLKD